MRILGLPKEGIAAPEERRGVSIIICAKNEAANLRKNLPAILSQHYSNAENKPKYEVIVVNDESTDGTEFVLKELKKQYSHLKDVPVPHGADRKLKGKKFALSRGVANATYDWLLLTDADCMPDSDNWLAYMVAPLGRGKEIVAGYGGYNEAPSFLNAFIRWETVHTFLQYSTYALAGLQYMAVGRNMACTKSVFQKAQQNEVWNALPSGDDDLLVRIAATADNMVIVSVPAAFTHSDAKPTLGEWIKQKQRHLSTGKYYKPKIKLLLGGYGVSHAVVWLGFVILLFNCCWRNVVILMAVRCAVYWLLWAVAGSKLREKKLVFLFPFFDIGWLVYNFAFLPYITWKNKKNWK